uniref:C2H2-type domain-containing protein n=1 Tax=Ananas comosus var. bracteatus TaxID=296719 RepID=A0A6V7QL63_ANACO|nr:unnamed protein product [Ananas comosus var. bracteatus]
MEIKEETMGSNYSGNGVGAGGGAIAAFAKGKRTKRQRPGPAVGDSSSGSSAASASVITEEDEDMANCLILLARGRCAAPAATDQHPPPGTAVTGVYECKTCSKCFPSFQALGGHRASHKKPKHAAALANANVYEEINKKPPAPPMHDEEPVQVVRPTVGAVKSARVHECSICGSEFNSGQALGGHMRRHRPLIAVAVPEEPKSERTSVVLELDLNLPAPADDDDDHHHQSLDLVHRGFAFGTAAAAAKRPLIFSSSGSALVDCHY